MLTRAERKIDRRSPITVTALNVLTLKILYIINETQMKSGLSLVEVIEVVRKDYAIDAYGC